VKAKSFSKALIYHLQWKVQLRRFLDGQGGFNIAELSPEESKFGKWLHSHEIFKYASRTEIREIEKVHTKLHQRAKRVHALKKLGKELDARQELRKMEATSIKLAFLLTTLKAITEN